MMLCKMHHDPNLDVYLCSVISLLVLLLATTSCAQSGSTLTPGSAISNPTTLVSPNGVFEVGFFSGARGSLSTPVYTLAIWYAIATKTAVWVAPDRALALSSNKSSLSLSTLGELQVHDNSGPSPKLVWTSGTPNVANATIDNTGNLVLVDNTNTVVWQSFDYPSDTLLPGQDFKSPQSLTAWKNDSDWSGGNYTLTWLNSTFLQAFWRNPYPWKSQSPELRYWHLRNCSQIYLTPEGDFRRKSATVGGESASILSPGGLGAANRLNIRVTLDKDGNLRMYSWSKARTNWTIEWAAKTNDCWVSGTCGPYAICEKSKCTCPTGFQWVDATDRRLGCQRINPRDHCGANSNDSFSPVLLADWRFNDDGEFSNVTLADCMKSCLDTCYCEAVIAKPPDKATNITSVCWLKRFALIGGFPTDERHSYLRVGSSSKLPPVVISPGPSSKLPPVVISPGPSSKLKAILASTTTSGALLLLALLGVSLFAVRKVRQVLDYKRLKDNWVGTRGSLVRFTFKEILLITAKFEHKIGEGGFGTVYKGQLIGVGDPGALSSDPKSVVTVAVKRLNKELSQHVEKEFMNEIGILEVIHHVHLVSLLGYCTEGEHRLLVYEYLENGSLDRILFREKNLELPVLEWKHRFAIALATARGLAYLHDDCNHRIIHCDVKPENILLDSLNRAKVADFGLSRMKHRDQLTTQVASVTEHIRGTLGYLAPEYWRPEGVPITKKVDVFSFGMVLLEIISGHRNSRPSVGRLADAPECVYFPTWVFPRLETDAFMDVVDPALAGVADPMEVKRALRVAFWCIQEKPQARPSMGEVVQMLQGQVVIILPVPRPAFFNVFDESAEAEQTRQDSHIISLLFSK